MFLVSSSEDNAEISILEALFRGNQDVACADTQVPQEEVMERAEELVGSKSAGPDGFTASAGGSQTTELLLGRAGPGSEAGLCNPPKHQPIKPPRADLGLTQTLLEGKAAPELDNPALPIQRGCPKGHSSC